MIHFITITWFNPANTLKNRYHYFAHFIDEKTEAFKVKQLV